jgi:hypothetical protein
MRKFPCRCRSCRARRTLAKHPEAYIREPRCACGGSYRVDNYRLKSEHKRAGCTCSGFPWDNGRHRKGSASIENGWYCIFWRGYDDAEKANQLAEHP